MAETVGPEAGVPGNSETVRTFLRLLEEKDIDAWIELWADDAEHFYPYGTRMFPGYLMGKGAIYDRWKNTPALFERFRFPLRRLWEDGDTVIAQFDADCVLRASGRRYLNHYICIFRFNGKGEIQEYWEYFDPILAGVDFGLANVHYRTP